ncbi:DEAD/DEAH box helicase [sulfur-oxidizing endosymbiont of Gigantopelta aegis]|uniref:DEAD/DEAH box helicase n=1 Tax=sulfur-oxidizing endosymbiont of Gigantopelta aegis TaxID=2794934 RepID=UPI0018DE5DFF|nr:DEAD/DEAH box helicase [sulfur-oxidizing endosymbiont of Gigantopelta aegis]
MSFTSLGLSAPILEAIADQGYDTPSPIQAQAIPAVIEGKDVMAAAQTGTGKTAGFTLPLLEILSNGSRARGNQARALVLTPTRELAAQVENSVVTYGKYLPLRSTVVFGGVKINPQMIKLRKGVDILVATPGRLLDLYNQNAVRFDDLEVLILDEADRMLDMGFIHDIRKIISFLPKKRQNLMFSATFSDDIRNLAKGMINNPVEISVSPRNTTVKLVKQWICPVDKKQKPALLMHLISQNRWEQVLVFSKTKHGANKLARYLEDYGIKSAAIHGNKSQAARTKALANFKRGAVQVLVATDIAARGLDIEQLPHVVNFDLPNVPEDYVHRIGRTGRAGATGEAVSLVSADEFKLLSDIERLIQQVLEREYIEGFDPVHDLPASNLRSPAKHNKSKKPKKPRTGHSDGQRSGENARGHKPTGKNKRHVSGQKRTGGSANSAASSGAKAGANQSSRRRKPASKAQGDNKSQKQNFYRQG